MYRIFIIFWVFLLLSFSVSVAEVNSEVNNGVDDHTKLNQDQEKSNTTKESSPNILNTIPNPLNIIDGIVNQPEQKHEEKSVIEKNTANSMINTNFIYVVITKVQYYINDIVSTFTNLTKAELRLFFSWFTWVLILLPLSLLIEILLGMLFNSYYKHLFIKSSKIKLWKFVNNIVISSFPLVIANVLLIFFVIYYIDFNYYKQTLYELILLVFFLRFIYLLVNIIFNKVREENLLKVYSIIKFTLVVIFSFILINYILNQSFFYSYALIQVNMFIFLSFLIVLFVISRRYFLRSLKLKHFYHIISLLNQRDSFYSLVMLFTIGIVIAIWSLVSFHFTEGIYSKIILSSVAVFFILYGTSCSEWMVCKKYLATIGK